MNLEKVRCVTLRAFNGEPDIGEFVLDCSHAVGDGITLFDRACAFASASGGHFNVGDSSSMSSVEEGP
ncbi:hypothetical protein [Mycobacterium stomatepiae]|uniref:Uncharacterized protein n=1 Tax=Mycobacterium stomatepiae TaxID=470076 RepID=A0A7I7QEC7_9MYCO|nr:hypothetical protein [Mycobacterium stomatepiae]MCV7167247.1 hypothetical protein [Mycobacterium stomatepiae]BBY24683.1 hypothetical protein MSTO_48880 [Mycobacterium stomatepiae]